MLLVVLLLSQIAIAASQNACTYSSKGQLYDLSHLSTAVDYVVHAPDGGYSITMNLCRPVSIDTCGVDCAACLQRNTTDIPPICLGRASTIQWSDAGLFPGRSGGIVASFTDGTLNTMFNMPNSFKITFVCDLDSAESNPLLLMWASYETEFEWHTKFACPQSHLACKAHSDCASCTGESGCAWCLGNGGSCVRDRADKPQCKSFATQSRFCPRGLPRTCDQFTTCASCANAGYCSWCLDSTRCLPKNSDQCQSGVDDSLFCDFYDEEFVVSPPPIAQVSR